MPIENLIATGIQAPQVETLGDAFMRLRHFQAQQAAQRLQQQEGEQRLTLGNLQQQQELMKMDQMRREQQMDADLKARYGGVPPSAPPLGPQAARPTQAAPQQAPPQTGQPSAPDAQIGAPPANFDTPLSQADEAAFAKWKAQYAPNDSGADYDLRGAFKAGVTPDPTNGHFPDTFKKPNHPTFSNQSQYAKFAPDKAGTWNGDTYVPPQPRPAPAAPAPGAQPARTEPTEQELYALMGSKAPAFIASVNKAKESVVDLANKHLDTQTKTATLANDEIAHNGKLGLVLKAGNYTPEAAEAVAKLMEQSGHLQQAADFRAHVAENPGDIKKFADHAISASPEAREEVRKDEARAEAKAAAARKVDEDAATLTGKKLDNSMKAKTDAGTDALGVTREQQIVNAETAKRDASLAADRKRNYDLAAKRFDLTLGAGLDANGKPLSPEERKTIALQDPTAVAMANYQIPPPNRTSTLGKALYDKILMIDGAYDATKYGVRNKVALGYSASGKEGQAMTSTDTALAHLDRISRAGAALKNGDVRILNSLANEVGAQVGGSAKATYDAIVDMVGPEVSKAVIGDAGGEGERSKMKQNFRSDTNDETRESVIGGAAQLLGERYKKQGHAYEADMGKPLARQLSPESQAVLQRYAGPGGAKTISVKAGDGSVHPFATDAEAKKFEDAVKAVGGTTSRLQ